MLTKGAVNLLNSQPSPFYPVLQIISIKPRKSGYSFRLSDSIHSIQAFYPSHQPLPVLFSAILIEEYEIISPFFILLRYSNLQIYSNVISNPEKISLTSAKKYPNFTLIKSLNLNTAAWTLRLRLISKTLDENSKPNSPIFTSVFIDENNDEILVSFNKETFDTYYTSLEVRKVYLVFGGNLRKYDKKSLSYKGKFILHIDKQSKVLEIFDDHSIKYEKFTFMDIKTIYKLNFPKRIDTCAVVKSISCSNVSSIELQDRSNMTIQLFLNTHIKNIPKFSVIVCKNVQYEPNSGYLISDSTSSLLINPKGFSEVEALRELSLSFWKDLSYIYTISEVKEIFNEETPLDELQFTGIITEVLIDETHPFWYPACSNTEKCSKKVESHSYGFFFCRACCLKSESFFYRFAVEVLVSDCTSSLKVKAFDGVGRELFGCTAEELAKCYIGDRDNADEIIDAVVGKELIFTISTRRTGNSIPISKISRITPSITRSILSEISDIMK